METLETTNPAEGEALPSTIIPSSDPSVDGNSSASVRSAGEAVSDILTLNKVENDRPTGEEQIEPSERMEEIERDGRKAMIPAWLKPELTAQAELARKTQELAEARRVVEAERDAVQRVGQAEISAQANLQLISGRLDQFATTDWNAYFDSDAAAAQKAFVQYQLLKDARQETRNYIEQLRSERVSRAQEEAGRRMKACDAEMAKHIPDWSPAFAARLKEEGIRHFRFSAAELDGIDDPRIMLALHAAVERLNDEAKQKIAQTLQQQQAIKPAERIGGAGVPPPGLDDRLDAEEWLRRRNVQIGKRRPLLG